MRLFLALFIFSTPLFCLTDAGSKEWKQAASWYQEAIRLDEKGAQSLESGLAAEKDQLHSRFKLTTYYSNHLYDEADKLTVTARLEEHYCWMVKKYPASPYFVFWGAVSSPTHKELYAQIGEAWQGAIKKNPEVAAVLGNAGHFWELKYPERAIELGEKAGKLEPENPAWNNMVGQILMRSTGPAAISAAAKAVEQFEAALLKSGNEEKLVHRLDLAAAAFKAGQDARASEQCVAALAESKAQPKHWNTGNVNFHANHILGRVAMNAGKLDEAAAYLLAAGATEGSPQLNSFGPDLSLAQDLLKSGKLKEVLGFLKDCKKFWKMDRGKLDRWIKQIESGASPELKRY